MFSSYFSHNSTILFHFYHLRYQKGTRSRCHAFGRRSCSERNNERCIPLTRNSIPQIRRFMIYDTWIVLAVLMTRLLSHVIWHKPLGHMGHLIPVKFRNDIISSTKFELQHVSPQIYVSHHTPIIVFWSCHPKLVILTLFQPLGVQTEDRVNLPQRITWRAMHCVSGAFTETL